MPDYKPYNARERFEQTATEAGRRRLGVIEYSPAKATSPRPRNTSSPFHSRSEGSAPGFFSSLWENFRYLIEDAVDNWRLRRETSKAKAKSEDDFTEESPDEDNEPATNSPPQAQRESAPQPKGDSGPDKRQRNQQPKSQGPRPRERQQGGSQPRSQQPANRQSQGQSNQQSGPRKPDLRDMLRQQQQANRQQVPQKQPQAPTQAPRPAPSQAVRTDAPAGPRPAQAPAQSNAGQTRRDLSRLHQSRRPKNPQNPPANS